VVPFSGGLGVKKKKHDSSTSGLRAAETCPVILNYPISKTTNDLAGY
jgi:hypothetical protein